jgi:hypothetical protein
LAAAILFLVVPAALGQASKPPATPDRYETARLVWTTLIAVDQANQTGNYSVLRDLAAPDFQKANDPARLATIFSRIRQQKLDLGRVVLATPVYIDTPRVLDNGLYRIKGSFPGRPVGIGFEMLFKHVDGDWRLLGISVAPIAAAKTPEAEGALRKPVPKPGSSGG